MGGEKTERVVLLLAGKDRTIVKLKDEGRGGLHLVKRLEETAKKKGCMILRSSTTDLRWNAKKRHGGSTPNKLQVVGNAHNRRAGLLNFEKGKSL